LELIEQVDSFAKDSKQMNRNILIIQTLLLVSLCGCSTTSEDVEDAYSEDKERSYLGSDCILIRTIRDYTRLDNRHLFITGSGKRTYFVALTRKSHSMRGSSSLRVDSRDEQLCPYGGDSIAFGSFSHDNVRVQSISRVSAEEQQELLIRFGLMDNPAGQAPSEPPEIRGAEVEELD
jgi:hypothetical protein